MSDSQEAKRDRQLQQKIQQMIMNGWGNIDPSIVERFANNNPAGINMDWGLRPGDSLSTDQFDSMINTLRNEYIGANNITGESYLSDPRSVVKLENGQYVYRPEQSLAASTGEDFYGIDRANGFWDGFGPAGLAMAMLGGLPMAAHMAGGAAAGAAGGSNATGVSSSIPAGDFSLAQPGMGVGGQGTAGLGLSTGTSGGVGAMGAGAGTATGVGLGLQPVASSGAAIGAGTMGAGAAGGGWWDTLLNTITGSPGSTGATGLSSILKGGGSLLEWLQSKENAQQLADAINAASEKGDPFGSQRGFYQNMLRDSYTDPNFWKNNAVFKGISDVASSDAQRVAAARGFNNSSNVLYDVADRIQKTGMNYATNFQGQLAQNAGAGISPGTSASIAAQGANQVMGANQQANGAMGTVLGNIPNIVNGIKGILA